MSQSNQGGGSFVPMYTDNDEISQVLSTSTTETRIARSGRSTPSVLPPGTFARSEMRRTAPQQRAVEEQNAVQAMVRRLERIDRVLSLYDQTLTTSQDADHLALTALPPTIRQLVTQLVETRSELRAGARIVGQRLHSIDTWIIQIETASEVLQEAFRHVSQRLDNQQATSSHLHQTIQTQGAEARQREEMMGQEMLTQRAEYQRVLVGHDATLKEVIQELRKSREERGHLEERVMELTEQVTSLNSGVGGKGKQSDPTPEPSAAGGVGGGGNGDPPENFGARAPGGSDDGDDDDEDDEDDDRRRGRKNKTTADKGRRDERPADNKGTEEENRFSRILSSVIAETSKRPAEPPTMFTNAGHEDIRFWFTRCQNYCDRNKLQWREEGDGIKYALGKMQGATFTPFAMAYLNQMTGELGYTKQEGYDQWKIFKDKVIRRFGPTHEDIKALRELYQIKYKGDIDEFLQHIESKNNRAKVTGIAFRKIVEDEVPEEAIRRMSMQQEYIDDVKGSRF